jgi:CRP-like cAMP-binding protein
MIGPDGAVGSLAVLGIGRAHAGAVIRVDTRAFRIAVSRLMDILPDAKFLAASLVADAEALIGRIHQMSACNAVHAVEARLARWLLRAADCLDSDSIPLTQELMSQILGVQRTTVNLMVRTMAQAGVLRNRRGRVEIIDRVGLESIACECYAHLHACVRPAEVPMRLPSLEPRRNDAVRHDCTSEHRT